MNMIAARLSQFLASKAVTIALLAALAAGGAYMYFEIKASGRLQAQADELRRTLAENEAERQKLAEISANRARVMSIQQQQLSKVQQYMAGVQARIDEAQRQAAEDLRQCMAMSVADGMRFGPSVQNPDGGDPPEPGVDG